MGLIKFFTYEKQTKVINLLLPDLPDNDFEKENRIVYNGKVLINGIKWKAMDWEYSEQGFELPDDEPFKYLYNPETNEITENSNYIEEEL